MKSIAFLLILTVSVYGQYSGGNGTQQDPYQIASSADLIALGANSDHYSMYFKLTADIDLSGHIFDNAVIAKKADPNNANFRGIPFTGVLDGDNHQISNLMIDGRALYNIGLFGSIGVKGKVVNLVFGAPTIFGTDRVGCLCGENQGWIERISLENATIKGNREVGGLCGINNKGTVSQCFLENINVSGLTLVGGLCGNSNQGFISQCYAIGVISGEAAIGGLCGECTGSTSTGGCMISSCFSSGNVEGFIAVGGLVGFMESYYNSIGESYSSSTVSGVRSVGGLCGESGWSFLFGCYASGHVSGYDGVGGLVGSSYDSSGIYYCYWDIDTSNQTKSVGGTGKTTSQMQSIDTFNQNWNISTTNTTNAGWILYPNSYPLLPWKPVVPSVVPDVNGLPTTEAITVIRSAGFPVSCTTEYCRTVSPDHICKQIPNGGVETVTGTTVILYISKSTPYSNGLGTATEPFHISNMEEWQAFITRPEDWNKHFTLDVDIDLSGQSFHHALVAPEYGRIPFSGVFDGNGHVIHNLTISGSDGGLSGMFGEISSEGQVKGLGLKNINITKLYGDSGGLCGYLEGTISQCYVIGKISSSTTSGVGGLCGYSKGTISQSYASCLVSGGMHDTGGLCGCNRGLIENSYAHGIVSGNDCIGGLCGKNYGKIINCYSTCAVSGNSNIGGFCGSNNLALNCFWDINSSRMTTSKGGSGRTTAQMQTISTFTSAGWDFIGETTNGMADVWRMRWQAVGYPILNWQEEIPGDLAGEYGVDMTDVDAISKEWLGRFGITDLLQVAEYWLSGIN